MKKSLLFALAILLAFVVATPASAQHRRDGRNNGRYGYQDGYRHTPLEAVTHRNMRMVDGIIGELGYGHYGYRGRYDSYRYDRYDYRYDYRYDRRHDTRNILLGTAAVVGSAILIDKIGDRNNRDRSGEEPSKCFERVVKSAKKQGVQVDTDQVLAMCSGQPLHRSEPERMSEQASGITEHDEFTESESFPQAQPVTPYTPRGAFVENGRLCNESDRPLSILINGRVVGTLQPNEFVRLSRLPAGQLSYRY